jgi:plastocyanin
VRIRATLAAGLVAAVVTLPSTALAQEGPTVAARATIDVPILEWAFSPNALAVAAGQTVTWTNDGDQEHTVSSETRAFDGTLAPGSTFSVTFNAPGTYAYFCDPHPWMTGTIVVTEAAGGDGSNEMAVDEAAPEME